MQPGWEHRRSASKRVLRRGSAEIRAPWIGPTMANGLLPVSRMELTPKIRSPSPTRIALHLFRGVFHSPPPRWMEPEEGIEPSTTRLRSECSAAELLRPALDCSNQGLALRRERGEQDRLDGEGGLGVLPDHHLTPQCLFGHLQPVGSRAAGGGSRKV